MALLKRRADLLAPDADGAYVFVASYFSSAHKSYELGVASECDS